MPTKIKLSIHSAAQLKNTEMMGKKTDGYCTAEIGKMKFQTSVVDNNLDPVWTFEKDFDWDEESGIVFTVWDKNSLRSDTFVGKALLPAEKVARGFNGPLHLRDKAGKFAGELKITIPGPGALDKRQLWTAHYDVPALVHAAAKKVPGPMQPYFEKAAPIIAYFIVGIMKISPVISLVFRLGCEWFEKIPDDLLPAVAGFVLCFFGGMFPATIAAVEAWRLCGGGEAMVHIENLAEEAEKAKLANEEDDQLDADGDGILDVEQISAEALLMRKMQVVMKAIDPSSVNESIAAVGIAWAGVVGTLKNKFVMTVTLSVVIAQKIYEHVGVFVEPMIKKFVDESYHKWVPVILQWICKVIAISIAWWIQRVLSAFHSAIRGSLMMTRGIINALKKRGKISFGDQDTYIDEVAAWGVAALGFLFQLRNGFGLPLLFRLFLWPLELVEWGIIWQVSS